MQRCMWRTLGFYFCDEPGQGFVFPMRKHMFVKGGHITEVPIERTFGCVKCTRERLGFQGRRAIGLKRSKASADPVLLAEACLGHGLKVRERMVARKRFTT